MRISAQMTGETIDFGASLSCGLVRHQEGTESGKEQFITLQHTMHTHTKYAKKPCLTQPFMTHPARIDKSEMIFMGYENTVCFRRNNCLENKINEAKFPRTTTQTYKNKTKVFRLGFLFWLDTFLAYIYYGPLNS